MKPAARSVMRTTAPLQKNLKRISNLSMHLQQPKVVALVLAAVGLPRSSGLSRDNALLLIFCAFSTASGTYTTTKETATMFTCGLSVSQLPDSHHV